MSVTETLEDGVDKVKSLSASPGGKFLLLGVGGVLLYVFLSSRKSTASNASNVAPVGATFGLGSGGGSPVSSPAPSMDEQLAYQEKLGNLQIKLQGLMNAQTIADQKQVLQLSVDQAAAQAAQALQATKDTVAYWLTPQTRTDVGTLTKIDTNGNVLSVKPGNTFTSSFTPFALVQAAQKAAGNQALQLQQAAADIVTNQQKELIRYQQEQIQHTNSVNNQQNLFSNLLGAASSIFGRSQSVPTVPYSPAPTLGGIATPKTFPTTTTPPTGLPSSGGQVWIPV